MKIGCSTPETTFEDETWRLKVKFTLQSISVVALHLRLQYIHAFGRYFSWLLKINNRSDLCIFHSLCRKDDLFTEKQQYYEEHSYFSQHRKMSKNILMMHLFITKIQLFTSQVVNRWTGVLYITWTLIFWRHPFTAEDPLVSKSCDAIFLQICSYIETNSSTSWMA